MCTGFVIMMCILNAYRSIPRRKFEYQLLPVRKFIDFVLLKNPQNVKTV